MKKIHVKNGMKKALAFSLAAAMTVPGIIMNGTIIASAEDVSVPTPAKSFSLEKGFRGDDLSVGKFGNLIAFEEEKDVYDAKTGRSLIKYKNSDKVIKQGSFDSTKTGDTTRHIGYVLESVPAGQAKQDLPYIVPTDGQYKNDYAWNQPTAAYDATKGMVFWLDDTMTNQSYPTYATTVDETTGIPNTDQSLLVKDTAGKYMEYEVINSAAEYANPFKGASATGLTFSAWIKNTTPYKAPVVYNKLGDLDGNGQWESKDALIVLQHSVGVETLDEIGLLFANVDGSVDDDGKPVVDSKDALEILKKSVGLIDNFEVPEPEVPDAGEKEVKPLKDSEFFHVERRIIGQTKNSVTGAVEDDERNITEREYLYCSGNGITYVGDWTDEETVCTWTLEEGKADDETVNLLSGKNGSKWIYVSYVFDGTDFYMYLNDKKVPLTKHAGAKYTNADIMGLVSDAKAVTYLGGRGGGMADNYNKYKIQTCSDYYMDDIAVYTSGLNEQQIAKAYTNATAAMQAAQNKSYNILKTFSFEGTSLQANELIEVAGSEAKRLPTLGEAGKKGKGVLLNRASGTKFGGVQLTENPFSGKSDLTGVSISYWIKAKPNAFGGVADGVLLSFIDTDKVCGTDKYSGTGKSEIYINSAFNGWFAEGMTSGSATNIGNIYKFYTYPYGKPEEQTVKEKKNAEIYDSTNNRSYYGDWEELKNSLAEDWTFVTITFNNAGFKMYQNGTELKNRYMDVVGNRFCDFYNSRQIDIGMDSTRKATNNTGARTLMDFITASDTKAYIGYAYDATNKIMGSETWYLDELSFYDKDLTAAEVRALYNSVK